MRARLAAERGQPQDLERLGQAFPEMGAPSESFRAADNPFSWSFFETYGAYPAVNDRHVVEFFPERFQEGGYHGKTLGVDTFSVERTIARGDQIYAEMQARAVDATRELVAVHPGETVVAVSHADVIKAVVVI